MIVGFLSSGCFFHFVLPSWFFTIVSAIIASSFYYSSTVGFHRNRWVSTQRKRKSFILADDLYNIDIYAEPYIHIKNIKLTKSSVVMYIGVMVPGGAKCHNIICARQWFKTCFMRGRDSIVRLTIGMAAYLYKVVVRHEKGRHNIKLL